MKAIWKGDISFGLVTIGVSLVSTEEANPLHFHLLNAKTKGRIRYQRVDESSGKVVPWNDIVKGYEYEKDQFLVVDETAFEKAGPELFKSIAIEEFVNLSDINRLYYYKPYYLIPEGKNQKAYVLLREALKKTHKVGVAKIILRSKEHLSLVMPQDHAILLYLLHFKGELREEAELNLPKDAVKTYNISEKELSMAVDLITNLASSWDPNKYHNDYQETLEKWLSKQCKSVIKQPSRPTKDAVVDFVALLKQSMKKNNSTKRSRM